MAEVNAGSSSQGAIHDASRVKSQRKLSKANTFLKLFPFTQNIFGKYSHLSWDRTNFASLFWSSENGLQHVFGLLNFGRNFSTGPSQVAPCASLSASLRS